MTKNILAFFCALVILSSFTISLSALSLTIDGVTHSGPIGPISTDSSGTVPANTLEIDLNSIFSGPTFDLVSDGSPSRVYSQDRVFGADKVELQGVQLNSKTGGTHTITFEHGPFDPHPNASDLEYQLRLMLDGSFLDNINGASIKFEGFVNNVLIPEATFDYVVGTDGGTVFSHDSFTALGSSTAVTSGSLQLTDLLSPYSLKGVLTIDLNGGSGIAINQASVILPEPSSFLSLACAILGLFYVRNKKK